MIEWFAAHQWASKGRLHAYRAGDPVALCNGLRLRPDDPPSVFNIREDHGQLCRSCVAIISRGGIQ
jgi:hypothetical protein